MEQSSHAKVEDASQHENSTRQRPKKLQRNTRACDFCHRRSIRCRPSHEEARCQNCVDFDITCTYLRPVKKRGVKATPALSRRASDTGEHASLLLHLTNSNAPSSRSPISSHDGTIKDEHSDVSPSSSFRIPIKDRTRLLVLSNHGKIRDLVEVYFEVVFPIFPWFHRQTLLNRIDRKEYLTDQPFFAAVMSLSALASARARDGALLSGRWEQSHFREPSSEAFAEAAVAAMPKELSMTRGLDYMRACGLLALLGIQNGNMESMHQYLGIYHSLVAMDSLNIEANWPSGIGIVETEERRRLYWSLYTLEVYRAVVWYGVIRCRESQSSVAYPNEVDDDFFSDSGFQTLPTGHNPGLRMSSHCVTNSACWLHGWNFTTEMYRILEHAMNEFRRRGSQRIGPYSLSDMFAREVLPQSVVLDKVMLMYKDLPIEFKEPKSITTRAREDIFSFQAANITATLQLVRMILFTSEDATVSQKCEIAKDLLEKFAKVPVFYLKAISSPLLYHLAGIGSILGSVLDGPLSESSYLQVRKVLLTMSDLLENLEVGMARHVGASERLRTQITRIDEYMVAQRRLGASYSDDNATSIRPIVPSNGMVPYATHPVHGLQPHPHWSHQPPGPMQFMDSSGMIGLGSNPEQFQFQLPPHLLQDFPWPTFDVNQGFGTF